MTAPRLLTNGRYRVLITAAGTGCSSVGDYQLTRWSGDGMRGAEGFFAYLRDSDTGRYWSAGFQPTQVPPDSYRVTAGRDVVIIERHDSGIMVRTEIAVPRAGSVEWRRYTITNLGDAARRLELTTCAEVVLNTPAGDSGHPAFSKLFVQTESLPDLNAVLARRRQRSPEDELLFMGHALFSADAGLADSPATAALQMETDRARFIGRGRTLANPLALATGEPLSGTVGNVLDPMLALRQGFTLAPGASVRLDAVLTGGTRRAAVEATLRRAMASGAGDAVFAAADAPDEIAISLPATDNRFRRAPGVADPADASEPLRFFNGFGGFSADGSEYVVRLDRTIDDVRRPPLPWTNVIANEAAGCVTSECGLGFTWSGNSRENRLTPWFNDPVSDPVSEALYLRDETAGLYWSPTPAPAPGTGAYETRHGFGYTLWRHTSQSLEQQVLCFMAKDEPVKIVRLRVTNHGSTSRSLSMFYFAEWVLGGLRSTSAPSVFTESARDGTMLMATNPANNDFGGQVAFASVGGAGSTAAPEFTADRAAFLGTFGNASAPAALGSADALDGRCGGSLDPCAAFRMITELAPGATAEWSILLGQTPDRATALSLAARLHDPATLETEFVQVREFWRELLGSVRVETPAPALDLMVNGWLSYQNLSCRIWARSALYQSGGAFGFRDQLQDAAALVYQWPELTRRQILLNAANQFVEGDVMHWWHPPVGRGIRTKFSDDLLWLPLLTQHYLDVTGDTSILTEPARFLVARELKPGEDEAFLAPDDSGSSADLYEHCCRSIDRSLGAGAHGLPLIGTGDWNDGMNRVGRLGRGESVWLGFFLYTLLEGFVTTCAQRGDTARVARYQARMRSLHVALNDGGWDGEWYRRAYYDDGTPLGSATSDECRIDAIAQAWSVISGVAPVDRANQALDAMEDYLVDEHAGLIRLLTPPFDRTPHDPGYIKGYLPGVRENGGQYTHGALWAVRALAEAGRTERAARLLEMLSPVTRGGSPDAIAVYQAEPYVVAADVYGSAPHTGRAGWTWYTGSAGWMFRVALESVLGLTVSEGRTLVLRPCIPAEWPGFSVWYRLPDGKTRYEIVVRRTNGRSAVRAPGLDARIDDGAVMVALTSDGGDHRVEVDLGADVGTHYRPSISPPERITSA